jgi:exosortase E/protease (VPEID-CTERM system)
VPDSFRLPESQATWARDTDRDRRRGWAVRGIWLCLLLIAELVGASFSNWFLQGHFEGWLEIIHLHAIFAGIIAALIIIAILGWQALWAELNQASALRSLGNYGCQIWLASHLLTLACLLEWTSLGFTNSVLGGFYGVYWFAIWSTIALFGLFSWAAAVLPLRLWIRWLAECPGAFVGGSLVGFAARSLVKYFEALSSNQIVGAVLWGAAYLLRLFGHNVHVNAKESIISTPTCSVYIGTACTGIEGITLIACFLAVYFWSYRRQLRFPHALLLLPIGVSAMWLLNICRIAILIELGSWKADVGADAFHSLAGWLCFNLMVCAIVVISHRLKFFTKSVEAPKTSAFSSRAALFIVPLLVIIMAAMFTSALSGGFDRFYPIRVIAVGVVFWLYRSRLRLIRWSVSRSAVGLGTLAFMLWIWLQPASSPLNDSAVAAGLKALSAPAAALWLAFRIVGGILTVPFAEELAFRGYLTRRLISKNFDGLPVGQFTWLSFGLSSLIFGLAHGQRLAATVAGMLFALALYRRGQLCDAIAAHATTNGMLAVFVLSTHRWSLWS